MVRDDQTEKSDSSVTKATSSRRNLLLKSGGALAAMTSVASVTAAAEERCSYAIREGTADETEVHVTKSGEPDPTVVVVGGFHGNEESGYRAADDVAM